MALLLKIVLSSSRSCVPTSATPMCRSYTSIAHLESKHVKPNHSLAVIFADQMSQERANVGVRAYIPLLVHAHTVFITCMLNVSQQCRSFSTSFPRFNTKDEAHTADSYFKDIDSAPPPSEKTYQVDGSNPTVQRPNEATASGEYSRAGPRTKEYATVRSPFPGELEFRHGLIVQRLTSCAMCIQVEGETYDVPPSTGPEKDQKSRYGNTQQYYDRHGSGSDVSKPDEGPEGASAGGRKPEGRS